MTPLLLFQVQWRRCAQLLPACLALLSGGWIEAQQPDPQLVPVGSTWKFLTPSAEPAGGDWRGVSYDDSSWSSGVSGFSVSGGEATLIPGTTVTSILLRAQFQVSDPSAIQWLVLRVDYSHGFVAYLNGAEIARRGVTGTPPAFDALAVPHARGIIEDIDVTAGRSSLQVGTNVLAIQLHGAQVPASDLVMVPELCANFQRGPYVQRASEQGAAILWRTPVPATTVVDYGLTPALGLSLTNPVSTISHRAILTGLTPGTEYYYRVRSTAGSVEATSPTWTVHTAPTAGGLSFGVLGDSGSGWVAQLRVASALSNAAPDLVLHTGDTAYGSMNPNTADIRCLSVYAPQMRSTFFFPTFGNHDLYSDATTFLEAFSVPTNSATGTGHFYSFDHGDVHFVSLHVPTLTPFAAVAPYALAPGSTQLQWLTNDLRTTTKPWRVLFLHSPLFTSSGHRHDDYNNNGIADRLELQEWLLPIAAEQGVQLVFSGHDHCFERFTPHDGVHCYVTGGGGYSLYGLVELDALSERFEARHHCLNVTVNGDTATVQAIDSFGVVFDTSVVPRISPVRVRISVLPSGLVRLLWNSDPGRSYTVEVDAQPGGAFVPLSLVGLPLTTDQHQAVFDLDVNTINPSGAPLFFRVAVLP